MQQPKIVVPDRNKRLELLRKNAPSVFERYTATESYKEAPLEITPPFLQESLIPETVEPIEDDFIKGLEEDQKLLDEKLSKGNLT